MKSAQTFSVSKQIQEYAERLRAHSHTGHFRHTKEAGEEFCAILRSVVRQPEETALHFRARFLSAYAETFTPTIDADELLAGNNLFGYFQQYLGNDCGDGLICPNHGHIIVDYGMALSLGIPGLRNKIEKQMANGDTKESFLLAIQAFERFVERYAEIAPGDVSAVCNALLDHAPVSFREAIQLLWFMQIFLHVEGLSTAAVSFGRLDQYLAPYTDGSQEDFEILCAFLLKCGEGDESQNLTLGGNGKENCVSLMVLEAMRELRLYQPSISIRLHPSSSPEFRKAAFHLAENGYGQPAFFNDTVVQKALTHAQIPQERAEDWGIVGCYEASPQGDCMPFTVGMGVSLPSLLMEFLDSAGNLDFQQSYEQFKVFLKAHYHEKIFPCMKSKLEYFGSQVTSPFESLCLGGCIESGIPAEQGGATCRLFGIQFMGLGTVVDSFLALKKKLSPAEARTMDGKFGSNDEFANGLAADLTDFIGKLVLEGGKLPNDFQPNPGLFWFGNDIHISVPATPDGRTAQEPVSYGCGPTHLLQHSEPTSILNSLAALHHDLFSNGAPCMLTLGSPEHMEELVDAYFKQGGSHIAFNIVDSSTLEDAIEHPQMHSSLLIKISGFTARFIDLDSQWKQALLIRSRKGI